MSKRIVVFLLLVSMAGFACAQTAPQKWVEGKNYFAIANPRPTHQPDKVVVTEVFSFGCPYCNALEPYIDKLRAALPKGAVLEELPAGWSAAEDWPVLQRAYFTAKALGLNTPKSRDAMFKAIWGPNGSLATYGATTHRPKPEADLPTIEDIAKFYAKFGGKPSEFVATSKSFAINLDIKRANQQIVAWGITGTPTLVVDGKWRANVASAKGQQQLIDLTLYLAKKELAAKQAQ